MRLKAGKFNNLIQLYIVLIKYRLQSSNRLFYCMSKAALEQVTRCMALEYAKFGVRVNSVAPGVIHTDIHSHRDTYDSTRITGVNEVCSCVHKRSNRGIYKHSNSGN